MHVRGVFLSTTTYANTLERYQILIFGILPLKKKTKNHLSTTKTADCCSAPDTHHLTHHRRSGLLGVCALLGNILERQQGLRWLATPSLRGPSRTKIHAGAGNLGCSIKRRPARLLLLLQLHCWHTQVIPGGNWKGSASLKVHLWGTRKASVKGEEARSWQSEDAPALKEQLLSLFFILIQRYSSRPRLKRLKWFYHPHLD